MARRGANEGSIHHRTDGRWVAVVHLGYDGGRRRRKSFYGKSRAEVAKRLTAALRAHEQGLPLAPERLTVGVFLQRWLTQSAQPSLRPRTFQSYEMIVERHLLPAFGRIQLSRITPDAVQAYINRKLADGLDPYTVRNHHALLRRALNQAVRWGFVPRNVASLVTPPRAPREEVRPFSTAEARTFLDAIRGDRLAALYAVALGLGLRQGEVLGLTWSDLDLDAGTLTVRRTLQRYDRAYHLDEPKTLKSSRKLALPAPLVEALRAHRARQLEERLRAGPLWSGDGWNLVFTTEMGNPVSGAVVTHRFQAMLQKANLPRQRFHDLRHAAASFMLAQGVPLRVVMEVLGHSEIAVTANTYSHVMPELQREATERVGRLLWAT